MQRALGTSMQIPWQGNPLPSMPGGQGGQKDTLPPPTAPRQTPSFTLMPLQSSVSPLWAPERPAAGSGPKGAGLQGLPSGGGGRWRGLKARVPPRDLFWRGHAYLHVPCGRVSPARSRPRRGSVSPRAAGVRQGIHVLGAGGSACRGHIAVSACHGETSGYLMPRADIEVRRQEPGPGRCMSDAGCAHTGRGT